MKSVKLVLLWAILIICASCNSVYKPQFDDSEISLIPKDTAVSILQKVSKRLLPANFVNASKCEFFQDHYSRVSNQGERLGQAKYASAAYMTVFSVDSTVGARVYLFEKSSFIMKNDCHLKGIYDLDELIVVLAALERLGVEQY